MPAIETCPHRLSRADFYHSLYDETSREAECVLCDETITVHCVSGPTRPQAPVIHEWVSMYSPAMILRVLVTGTILTIGFSVVALGRASSWLWKRVT